MPSLIECVFKNDLTKLRTHLAKGADPNERDDDGRTALIHAAIDNQLEAAKILLGAGAQVDTQDESGFSSLHYAAQEYYPEMASLLIEQGGATVDLVDIHGNTPLTRAVFNSFGKGELISILLKAGANRKHRNKYGKTPIGIAKTIANYDIKQFFT